MIDIQKIETFLAAAENLSLSEAAKQLHSSQPAVSHQIKVLEQELDVTLFTRSNIELQLTEAGRLLLPWARRLLHDTNELKEMISSLHEDIVGELRISCSTTAGKYILPQLAARFCLRYPGIKVRILACGPEHAALNLLEGEAHIRVVSSEVSDASFESQKFFRDTITLIVPPHHRWAARTSIEPAEILEEKIIIREETAGTRRVVLSELAEVAFRLANRSDLPDIVRMLAEDELGSQRERFELTLPEAYYAAFEAIEADPNQELVVAELDGEVVGTLQLSYLPSLSYQGGTRAQVESVRVLERLRGQGIGAEMMEWAIARARQRGCRLIQLSSHKSRADAHRFYEKLGFTATHIGMKKNLEY